MVRGKLWFGQGQGGVAEKKEFPSATSTAFSRARREASGPHVHFIAFVEVSDFALLWEMATGSAPKDRAIRVGHQVWVAS